MTVRRLRRRTKVLVAVAAAVLAIGGIAAYAYFRYGSVVRYTADHGRVTVQAEPVSGLGTVLVTNKGFALYMFPPDAARRVSCTGGCADAWPPLIVPRGGTVAGGAGVRTDLLGTTSTADGQRVVTYHGWPLYTYLGDADPGHATGQGVDDDGGHWYVMRTPGQIVRHS